MTDYQKFRDAARRLLEPLSALMTAGRADLPIKGGGSAYDNKAERLEAFARPLLLAALWVQAIDRDGGGDAAERALRERVAAWFRAGLVAGCEPGGAQAWGPDANYHQINVEMGLMAIALQLARPALWDPLSEAEKKQVAGWFATSRGCGYVNNNHLFMAVHTLEFLGSVGFGDRTDRGAITAHLNQLETMHRGGGWFEDGINQAFDYYNAFAFHFYSQIWVHLHGARELERAARWCGWTRSFVDDFQHFFAASGEHPAFGRSMIYRFAVSNVFGLAALNRCTDLPPGRLRRLVLRNVGFFLQRPITQEQGCLAWGWTDVFPGIAEGYSCAASPLWAAKGFASLLLPAEHPFWTAPEEALPSERGDFARPIRGAGLLVRGTGGVVEIVNAGSMVSVINLKYGAWKWSKLAYRTGVGFAIPRGQAGEDWSPDSALTAQLDDGRVFGRHSTVCVELDEAHAAYTSNLGSHLGQSSTAVETFVWWNRGWLLSVHRIFAHQSVVLRLGGFALPSTAQKMETEIRPDFLSVFAADGCGSALQGLTGFRAAEWDLRLGDSEPRRHLVAPYHATPLLRSERVAGATIVAGLAWAGSDRTEAQPWRVTRGATEAWELRHPQLGVWPIEHWALPAIA